MKQKGDVVGKDLVTALFDEEEISRRHDLSVKKDNSEEIAKKMIENGKMSLKEIADCTGLTLAEVEKLANIELVQVKNESASRRSIILKAFREREPRGVL